MTYVEGTASFEKSVSVKQCESRKRNWEQRFLLAYTRLKSQQILYPESTVLVTECSQLGPPRPANRAMHHYVTRSSAGDSERNYSRPQKIYCAS